ncbi:MAG: TRAP transporter substrate-binding protein DctP [Spirochaetaceae bacterium]|jgi:TRAP-type C4-dicarboxylate transport system substrate-binding protein|nr:TRAP transporter substrate-binding protein DctP [Spirochaetaceae bacterium]
MKNSKLRCFGGMLLIMVIFSAPLFAGGNKEAPAEGTKKLVFKLSHVFLPEQPLHIAIQRAADNINRRTNGRIEIQIFPDGQIASGVDGVEQVVQNSYFINVYDSSCVANWVPDLAGLVGPMLYQSGPEYSAVCQSDLAQSLCLEAENQGIKILALDYNFGMRGVLSTRRKGKVQTLAELQGAKIRMPNTSFWIETMNSFGAAAVGMPWAEVYNAMQAGVVDGLVTTLSDVYDNSMWEVGAYFTKNSLYIGTGAVMLSRKIWETELTEEERRIFQEEFTAGALYNNNMVYELEARVEAEMAQKGLQFLEGVELDQYQQRAKKWFDDNKSLSPGFYDRLTAEIRKVRGN